MTDRWEKWRLLLPGASEPRLTELNPPGLQVGLSDCVTQPEQPEHSCHWQLWNWPDNGGTMPSKSTPFTPSSILFRPRNGGVAGYRPRVRKVYYNGHLSPYPACAGTDEYRRKRLPKKE